MRETGMDLRPGQYRTSVLVSCSGQRRQDDNHPMPFHCGSTCVAAVGRAHLASTHKSWSLGGCGEQTKYYRFVAVWSRVALPFRPAARRPIRGDSKEESSFVYQALWIANRWDAGRPSEIGTGVHHRIGWKTTSVLRCRRMLLESLGPRDATVLTPNQPPPQEFRMMAFPVTTSVGICTFRDACW